MRSLAILFLLSSMSGFAIQTYTPELDKDIASVQSRRFHSQNEWDEFKGYMTALDNKWRSADEGKRAMLFLRAADVVSSSGFNNEDFYEKYADEQEYALDGLAGAITLNNLPLTTEMKLVMHLRTDMTRALPSSNEFVKDREQKSLYWVHAWQRMEEEQAKVFTEQDMPVMNVMTPRGTRGVPAGVSPEAIKDPKLRREYESAIQENRNKSERLVYHTEVMNLKGAFERMAEHFFVSAYSRKPANLSELTEILAQIKNEDAKARIMKAVQHEQLQSSTVGSGFAVAYRTN